MVAVPGVLLCCVLGSQASMLFRVPTTEHVVIGSKTLCAVGAAGSWCCCHCSVLESQVELSQRSALVVVWPPDWSSPR